MEARGGRGCGGVDRVSDWNGGEGGVGVRDDCHLHRCALLALTNGFLRVTEEEDRQENTRRSTGEGKKGRKKINFSLSPVLLSIFSWFSCRSSQRLRRKQRFANLNAPSFTS